MPILRIRQFLSHVFLLPEETPAFRELFVDNNPHYRKPLGEYWHLSGAFVALEYDDTLKAELEAYKYYSREDRKELFVPRLFECFGLLGLEALDSDMIVTTVPVHFLSRLKRGYNHSELLARGVANEIGSPFCNLLKKSRWTRHQARLTRSERLRNVRNSFAFREKYLKDIAGKDVLLVDDVISTGSTANECAELLRKNGAKRVFGLFLATTLPTI